MADALDSGSSGSNTVWVQVPSSAPIKKTPWGVFFIGADEDGERKPFYKGQAPALILREGGTAKVPPSHIPLLAVIPGGCRIGLLIAADEGGERIPFYKGQAPALILREGGTAKVPPSHFPLLAVIPGGCRIGLIGADEDGERKPFYKGQAPALILREGGTAKAPPFYSPTPASPA